MKKNYSCISIALLVLLLVVIVAVMVFIPVLAEQSFGPASSGINLSDRYTFAISLLWNEADLTSPVHPGGREQEFIIQQGESVFEISDHLELEGLIHDSKLFRTYLIWKGLDTSVQAGNYVLNPGMTGIQIAHAIQDATPSVITINVWSGWRMEEIAASLPTSGLRITPEEFLTATRNSADNIEFIPGDKSVEGFLFPGSYPLPRGTTAYQLVSLLLKSFSDNLSMDLKENFEKQGLDVYQAVILASIVEKEAVVPEEQPMIASVFYNRLNMGMKLDSDPTVQYAVGYDNDKNSWWKNPLTYDDLAYDSPYNTYLYTGLPPSPIANPGISALRSVAYPAQTPYYYFRARCDGSGLHFFAETFEEHLQNACQ